jgi:hypothetical protein
VRAYVHQEKVGSFEGRDLLTVLEETGAKNTQGTVIPLPLDLANEQLLVLAEAAKSRAFDDDHPALFVVRTEEQKIKLSSLMAPRPFVKIVINPSVFRESGFNGGYTLVGRVLSRLTRKNSLVAKTSELRLVLSPHLSYDPEGVTDPRLLKPLPLALNELMKATVLEFEVLKEIDRAAHLIKEQA